MKCSVCSTEITLFYTSNPREAGYGIPAYHLMDKSKYYCSCKCGLEDKIAGEQKNGNTKNKRNS